MIEILQADIEKYEADAARLTREITKHDDEDYTESIDALNEDIQTLQAQAHDVKQAAAA